MLQAKCLKYILRFKTVARTSRASMSEKETYFIQLSDSDTPDVYGLGEAAIFRGLSADDSEGFESELVHTCERISTIDINSIQSSAIRFGLETAISDLHNGGSRRPFSVADDWGIRINGLIWMADKDSMIKSVRQKINDGFACIKLKIGGISFDEELDILRSIRNQFGPADLEIRLDANGAFTPTEAMSKLDRLSAFCIHSIEQPIRQHNLPQMARICRESPIPVALDEELIGMTSDAEKIDILTTLKPSYIILKPSLCGGFAEADKWIDCAERLSIGWWATSALESDIGLNAIARWLSLKKPDMPQGLGTGRLYVNNIDSPLSLNCDILSTDKEGKWNLSRLTF